MEEQNLILKSRDAQPGTEWSYEGPGWLFLRVAEGVGYSFSRGTIRELAVGDVVVVPQGLSATIRASQVGMLKMEYFAVLPEYLHGLLTLGERNFLENAGQSGKLTFLHFEASHEIARHFSSLPSQLGTAGTMTYRCQLLALAAKVLAAALPVNPAMEQVSVQAQDRLRQVMGRLTESEFRIIAPEQLARMCRCSVRHLNRLFRETYDTSIGARQMELRLEQAKVLLKETDAKIIDVGMDCGFRSVGLFNQIFKRRFGTTPGKWREEAVRKPKLRKSRSPMLAYALSLFFLMFVGTASAQTSSTTAPSTPVPPAPASALPQPASRPAPATNAPVRTFAVREYAVQGNTIFSEDELRRMLADYMGEAMTVERAREAQRALQMAYRGRGYATVAVTLPPQQITNGVLKMVVLEGRLTDITVSGNRFFSSNNVRRALPHLTTNLLLNTQWFQPELDRANANSDRQISPVIGPGPEPGTSALSLEVKDRLPLHGRLEVHNRATPSTPEIRVDTAMQYNNLWQHEHQIGLQYSFTPEEMKPDSRLPRFFDQPLISSYSAFYRLPLSFRRGEREVWENVFTNRAGPFGITTFGVEEATRQFRPPEPLGRLDLIFFGSRSDVDTGINFGPFETVAQNDLVTVFSQANRQDLTVDESLGSRLNIPLKTVGKLRSTLTAGVDFKRHAIAGFSTNLFFSSIVLTQDNQRVVIDRQTSFAQPVRSAAVTYLPLSLSWTGVRPDKSGSLQFNLQSSANVTGLFSEAEEFKSVGYSSRMRQAFFIAGGGLTREQRLYEEWMMTLRVNGQWADSPLLSTEQFPIGGINGVRGYREGQTYGDAGWRATLEPRTPVVEIGMVDGSMPMRLRGSIFTDYGENYLLDKAAVADSRVQLWGAGVALGATVGDRWDFRAAAAWPLLDVPGAKAGQLRVYFSISAQF